MTASNPLPETGFVGLKQLIGPGNPLPISKSTLYSRIAKNGWPAPCKISGRKVGWRVEDVRKLLCDISNGEA